MLRWSNNKAPDAVIATLVGSFTHHSIQRSSRRQDFDGQNGIGRPGLFRVFGAESVVSNSVRIIAD
jgi:hypothetical protein